MRLLLALPDAFQALVIGKELQEQFWKIDMIGDGKEVASQADAYDLILLHHCLAGMDGRSIGDAIAASALLCPPRILFICPPEFLIERPQWADVTVHPGVSTRSLCSLLILLAQKPLPQLAAAQNGDIVKAIENFLDDLSFSRRLKGRLYTAWLLERMIPSSLASTSPLGDLYAACARSFQVTPASVERCVRIAVENVFTQGSMAGIERYFGATVDPERGKPTNRAFLVQSSEQLRLRIAHSRTAERSPNRSEMHHSPAAPTSV